MENRHSPLAHRMRPQSFEEFVGHDSILGAGKNLRIWIESDQIPSMILWGPPGVGKTTLARVIASKTQRRFISLSAVSAGVKDIKSAAEQALIDLERGHRPPVLFLDEIHRLNRGQQDALLPYVEEGRFVLVGATTENPSFEINRALISRTKVIRLEALTKESLVRILQNALQSKLSWVSPFHWSLESLEWIADRSQGDARKALNILELFHQGLIRNLDRKPDRTIEVAELLELAKEIDPILIQPFDKAGEIHYDTISAFIKSVRGSDPQAALYYLAVMLEGGEDPLFIARRLVVLASEDIGNADPQGLTLAISGQQAVDFVGMPEARIVLAQVTTYLCLAPKSNSSYEGIENALEEVRSRGAEPPPLHLRNPAGSLLKSLGYGKGYLYPHHSPGGWASQNYLPDKLRKAIFYRPKEIGVEKDLKKRWDQLTQPQKQSPESLPKTNS